MGIGRLHSFRAPADPFSNTGPLSARAPSDTVGNLLVPAHVPRPVRRDLRMSRPTRTTLSAPRSRPGRTACRRSGEGGNTPLFRPERRLFCEHSFAAPTRGAFSVCSESVGGKRKPVPRNALFPYAGRPAEFFSQRTHLGGEVWCERRVKEASPTHSRLIYQPGTSLPPAVVHGKGRWKPSAKFFGKRPMTQNTETRNTHESGGRSSEVIGIVGIGASSGSGHRRDRGIVGIGASSGSGHRRDRGIVGIGASSGSGHRRDRGIVGIGASSGSGHRREGCRRSNSSSRICRRIPFATGPT